MEGVIEAGDLPESEKVYLKKGILGYTVVYPLKNEDGTYNWKNLFHMDFKDIVYIGALIVSTIAFALQIKEMSILLAKCLVYS